MARFEENSSTQGIFLALQLDEQFEETSREKILKRFVTERVDIKEFAEAYKNDCHGREAKNPRDMIATILMGHITGSRTSRKIEELLRKNISFMYISYCLNVDHSVICEFKIKFQHQIIGLLGKLLYVLNEMGQIDWDKVVIDGTKIKACASKSMNVGKERTQKVLKTYQKMAEKIIQRDLAFEKENKSGMIDEQKYHAEKSRINRQKKKYESIIRQINEYCQDEAKQKTADKEQYNLTDPESKLMMAGSRDHFIQAYNAILMVSDNDIIVGHDVITRPEKNYTGEFVKRVEDLKKEIGAEDASTKYLMDSGFQDMEKILDLEAEGRQMYVDTKERDFNDKSQKRKYFKSERTDTGYVLKCSNGLESKGYYDPKRKAYTFSFWRGKCTGCPNCNKCYEHIKETTKQKTVIFKEFELKRRVEIDSYFNKMNSEEGQRIYSRRIGKEHVNANLKTQRNFQNTNYRGRQKVLMDIQWAVLAHNFIKYSKCFL